MAGPRVENVALFPNREVGLSWDDGREDYLEARFLRQSCPCAECVDEVTGERRLDPASIPESMTVREWQPVGRYGVRFVFADAHDSGIYSFESLRRLAKTAGGD